MYYLCSVKNETIHVITKDGIELIFDKKESDKVGNKINIMIRPENIKISKNVLQGGIKGTIKELIYDGVITKLVVSAGDKFKLKVTAKGNVLYNVSDEVYLKIEKDSVIPIREM